MGPCMSARPEEEDLRDLVAFLNGKVPTESDLKILCALLDNLETPINPIWDAAARELGLETKAAIEKCQRLVKKYRLQILGPDGTKLIAARSATSVDADGAAESDATAVEDTLVRSRPATTTTVAAAVPAAAINNDNDNNEGTTASTPVPGMANLTVTDGNTSADNEQGQAQEQPETPSKPSKPSKPSTTASGKGKGKLNATEASNPKEDTPTKKEQPASSSTRKPRGRLTASELHDLEGAALVDTAIDRGGEVVRSLSALRKTINAQQKAIAAVPSHGYRAVAETEVEYEKGRAAVNETLAAYSHFLGTVRSHFGGNSGDAAGTDTAVEGAEGQEQESDGEPAGATTASGSAADSSGRDDTMESVEVHKQEAGDAQDEDEDENSEFDRAFIASSGSDGSSNQ